jgi:DNA-binding NarL/FixJ family response regulator
MSEGQIVVVDDSYVLLERIRTALRAEGYEVYVTTAAASASMRIKTADLAIIDFHMPGADGGQLLAMLKAAAPTDSSCLYYLYSSDKEVAARYRDYGFDGAFLRKGEEAVLATQVSAVFRSIRMRKLAKKLRQERLR